MSDKSHEKPVDVHPIHKRLRNRNSIDFSHATLRRLALMIQTHDHHE